MTLDAVFEKISILFSPALWAAFPARFDAFLIAFSPYGTVLSLLFLTGIVYCFLRLEQIVEKTRHEDHPHLGEAEAGEERAPPAPPQTGVAKRFERVRLHVHSDRESDWRLAVLEADVLLDEMVTGMGYHGDSLGEKLKGIEQSDFTTLEKAWEAHVVRNRIAHEGAAFALTEREAKRVIGLYEEVFREFQFI
ncbi:MAG: Uncharacterized protein Greene041679_427 [Parcubacteria group bacterium Greene0416_79]|nr:MAG: Uncharacterized protein Greene041679_427 [Parcubacteria group bacterium Greene0416_79]